MFESSEGALRIRSLDYETHRNLIWALEINDAWRLVAENSETFSLNDIRSFERDSSPSSRLLNEMDSRLCTVPLLCGILDKCHLYDALSLLKEPEPLEIIQQPGKEQVDRKCVPLGEDFILECRATGLPPPHYLWYQDNHELPEQTSSILTIKNFSVENEGDYTCCVSQDCEEPTHLVSWVVSLELQPVPPKLKQQPPPQIICNVRQDISLHCLAVGQPAPTFQWYHGNHLLDGETFSTLMIKDITLNHKGSYRCCVSNTADDVWTNKTRIIVYDSPLDSCDLNRVRPTVTGKIALLIGNENYQNLGTLKTPSNDVETIAAILADMNFKVLALRNLSLVEMRNSVKQFCQLLIDGAYGFFYYVGHGFEIQDKFMLPVDSPGPSKYLRTNSLCEKEVIRDALEQRPRLFVILLDMCLKVPDRTENPGIYSEMPDVYKFHSARNLVQGYATTSNQSAYERESDANGIYVKHLQQHLAKDIPIQVVLQKVREGISNESPDAADRQMPFDSSNIADQFRLTDSVIEDEEMEHAYRSITSLPPETRLEFKYAQTRSTVKFQVHRNCFHNALDIRLTKLQRWRVWCQPPAKDLELELQRQDGILIVTIYNLQKTKKPLVLTIELHHPTTDKMVDKSMLDLKLPLIAPANLWWQLS